MATLQHLLTKDITFATGINAKRGELLVLTTPSTLSLHPTTGDPVAIDLVDTPANWQALLQEVWPAEQAEVSYKVAKAFKFNTPVNLSLSVGDLLICTPPQRVIVMRAGSKVGEVDVPMHDLKWLKFIGTLTLLT